QADRYAPEAAGVADQQLALYGEPGVEVEAICRVATEAIAVLNQCPEIGRWRGGADESPASTGQPRV
ncbi:MAG: hypothetical protein KC442_01765, partial [Thermomicrobiales bacterium]|nr:hypothetical protein [Thermomicrobiales bacterium]